MATDDPLQRYRVMEPLGSGTQGSTFRGVDRDTDRPIAIKVVSLGRLKEWKTFDLFEREVAALKTLDHPSIPKYIDSFSSEASGDYFLVMELVEGRTLSECLAGKYSLSAKEVRSVLDQGLEILEYLHGLAPPVIHRDIKPGNLILDRDGKLFVVDFGGIRRAMRPDGGSTMVGTFGYMAPEQLHGDASPATDIYALGATIVSLLAGRAADQLEHDGLRIDLSGLSIPKALLPALVGMLAPDPKDRFASVDAVRSALKRPKPGRQAPSKEQTVSPSEKAIARRMSPGVRMLARTPAPLSILVWVLTALGSGGLLVFEVVVIPVLRQIALGLQAIGSKESRPEAVEEDMRELRASVKRGRETMGYIAGHTRPDDDERKSA